MDNEIENKAEEISGENFEWFWKNDHRYLSAEALRKFLPESGSHYRFIELVKNMNNKLAFCFRGNSSNEADIYYKNHVVFRITSTGMVKFNFDHARYMEDWEGQMEDLKQEGFYFKEFDFNKKQPEKRKDKYSIGEATMSEKTAKELSYEKLEKLSDKLCHIIDSFFYAKENQLDDQFRRCAGGGERKARRELTEKIVQQQLFLDPCFKRTKKGYFIYDMEFSQRQPYQNFFKGKNQPDMLAIHFDADGKPDRLVLVEVKSTVAALKGSSGIEEHIKCMERYPERLLPIRGREAYRILEQYIQLGLYQKPERTLVEEEFNGLQREILLIFTGEDTIKQIKRKEFQNCLEDYERIHEGASPGSAKDVEIYRRNSA